MTRYEAEIVNDTNLIDSVGHANAHMLWSIALYLEEPDAVSLGSAGLTDGPNDKKIDFIYIDQTNSKIVLAQGYFSTTNRDSAPANKASDLNTAAAWLVSGDLEELPPHLRGPVGDCREAISNGEIESVDLLYVHNLPESVNVSRELATAATHLRSLLADRSISVSGRELGSSKIEGLFTSQDSRIAVLDEIECPAKVLFEQSGPDWKAAVTNVPGQWLRDMYLQHSDDLFSANYRGFLGISKRKRINATIQNTIMASPGDFWAYNNGVTILTRKFDVQDDKTILHGLSIINGAQTTGSIGSVPSANLDLRDLSVICRFIQCDDDRKVDDIIRFNNTQNEITTWDQYSNDEEQNRIAEEFRSLGFEYSKKRGFHPVSGHVGIEEVAQPLASFHGRYREAYSGKNRIFDRKSLYQSAFSGKKARHILFVHTLALAIDQRRLDLKKKSSEGTIVAFEQSQLTLAKHIRFKQFFIALVGRVLESVLGMPCDVEIIAFSQEQASSSSNSLVSLTAAWMPVVETVLTLLVPQIEDVGAFSEFAQNEESIGRVSSQIEALIYASRSSLPLDDFCRYVSASQCMRGGLIECVYSTRTHRQSVLQMGRNCWDGVCLGKGSLTI